MNLTDDERRILVGLELDKAKKLITETEKILN